MYDYYSSKMHEWLAFILTFPEKKVKPVCATSSVCKKKNTVFSPTKLVFQVPKQDLKWGFDALYYYFLKEPNNTLWEMPWIAIIYNILFNADSISIELGFSQYRNQLSFHVIPDPIWHLIIRHSCRGRSRTWTIYIVNHSSEFSSFSSKNASEKRVFLNDVDLVDSISYI